ncbi:MAG: hypothetical protein QM703_22875 [Gemmatales bacterium]
MVDVGLLVTGIKGTLATLKKAQEISKSMANIELRQIIMELSEELLDVQAKVIELREEISDLRDKAKDKEDLSKLVLSEDYLIDPDLPGVAYCLKCREDKKAKSVMTEMESSIKFKTSKNYVCKNCNHIAGTFIYEEPVMEDHPPIRHPFETMNW